MPLQNFQKSEKVINLNSNLNLNRFCMNWNHFGTKFVVWVFAVPYTGTVMRNATGCTFHSKQNNVCSYIRLLKDGVNVYHIHSAENNISNFTSDTSFGVTKAFELCTFTIALILQAFQHFIHRSMNFILGWLDFTGMWWNVQVWRTSKCILQFATATIRE